MESRRRAAAGIAALTFTLSLPLASGAAQASPSGTEDFPCWNGSGPAWNRTAEIAPVYEYPGTGEVFTSIAPGAQMCVDGNSAPGPGGTYQHLTADGSGGQSDGWINTRFVSY